MARRPWLVVGFVGLALALVVPRLGLPLLEPEEARYAEIPRQMLAEGRWLIPWRDGRPYLDKPPLSYWLVEASYAVFGVGEAAARLPSVLSVFLTVAVVCFWGTRTSGGRAGGVAAVVMLLTGDFLYRAPMVTPNGPLALFVTAGLAAGHIALLGNTISRKWWLASAAATAAGVLTKGPLALVVVVGPLWLFPWVDRTLARPRLGDWVGYSAAVVGLAGPWFLAATLREPDFVEYFWWKHHVERFLRPFDHEEPFWFYLPRIAYGVFPWSAVLVALALRRGGDAAGRWPPPAARVGLAAAVVGLTFLSLSGSKRPIYLLPVEPPLALAVGAWLSVRFGSSGLFSARRLIAMAATTAAVFLGAVLGWLPRYSQQFSVRDVVLSASDEATGPDVAVVCLGHGWDSVGFYLRRSDVTLFLPPRADAFRAAATAAARTVVFVPTGPLGEDTLRELAATGDIRVLGSNRALTAAVVVRSEAEQGRGLRE